MEVRLQNKIIIVVINNNSSNNYYYFGRGGGEEVERVIPGQSHSVQKH